MDYVGYIASVLVLITFYMKDMVSLRVAALFSNFAFLIYSGALHLLPIMLLHAALIPINLSRLRQALRSDVTPGTLRHWFALHLVDKRSPAAKGKIRNRSFL
jgi:hypothetical protein